MKIAVSPEVDDYGYPETGRVANVRAFVDKSDGYHYGSSASRELDVQIGSTVYAVVADYSTSSTFGPRTGQSKVLDVFATEEEAADLLEAAKAAPPTDENGWVRFEDKYSFTHNGKQYTRAWVGYFERLNEIAVWDVIVRQHPDDPIRKGPGRYSLKRGH